MLSPFRAVLARPGARPLAIACLLGWFSAIGTELAVVLVVHHSTGSFALAGAASATQAVTAAAFAPLRGRLVDRRGGAGLLALAAGAATGAGLFVWASLADIDAGLLLGVALLGSCTLPLIGVARARWPDVAGPELTAAAHALNAATSDCAQLGAPTLVATASLVLSPVGALIALVAGACVAAGLLVRSGLPRHEPERAGRRSALGVLRGNPGLQAILAGDVAMGAWTAGMTIVVVAIAARHGQAALGGLLLAAGALGSIVMSLLAGGGALRASTGTRYVAGATLSALALVALLLASALPVVAVTLIAVGAGLGLQNVAVFEALDRVSPAGRTTEAFAWLTAASAGGGALGAAVSGRLIEQGTTSARLFILAVAAIGAVVVGARRRRFDSSLP